MPRAQVRVLRELANDGHTVVMTIHQPSAETAALFQRLVLLWKGRVAYDGAAPEAVEFLQEALGGGDAADLVLGILKEGTTAEEGGGDEFDHTLKYAAPAAAAAPAAPAVPAVPAAATSASSATSNPAEMWLRALIEPRCAIPCHTMSCTSHQTTTRPRCGGCAR